MPERRPVSIVSLRAARVIGDLHALIAGASGAMSAGLMIAGICPFLRRGTRPRSAEVAPSLSSPFWTMYVTTPPTYCRARVAKLGAWAAIASERNQAEEVLIARVRSSIAEQPGLGSVRLGIGLPLEFDMRKESRRHRNTREMQTTKNPVGTGPYGVSRTASDRSELNLGAQERTRTSTVLPPLGPEPSASTNSATWAGCV
jgi:hypothetical protein